MSELLNVQELGQAAPSGQGSPSAGAMLRAAREAQGLHIGALAVALKVPVKKLEALESDHFDLLPDTVFARALASSICRVLKIDAAPVLAGLPRAQVRQMKSDEAGLNTTFKEPGSGIGETLLAQAGKPVVIGVLLIVVAILGIAFWPEKPASAPPALSSNVDHVESDRAAASAPMDSAAPSQLSESSAASAIQTGASDVATVAALPDVLEKSAIAEHPAVLMLQMRGTSWVQVTDSKGVVQLHKTAMTGEILNVAGDLPLSVILGRADNVSVMVRGKPMDLTVISKDNVAKFEVK